MNYLNYSKFQYLAFFVVYFDSRDLLVRPWSRSWDLCVKFWASSRDLWSKPWPWSRDFWQKSGSWSRDFFEGLDNKTGHYSFHTILIMFLLENLNKSCFLKACYINVWFKATRDAWVSCGTEVQVYVCAYSLLSDNVEFITQLSRGTRALALG